MGFQPDGDAYSAFVAWLCLLISILVFAMALINAFVLLRILKARRSSYETLDDLLAPPLFYVTLLCYAAAFILPLVYIGVYAEAMLKIKWLVLELGLANSAYWIASTAALIALRLQPSVPLYMIAFHSIFIILELLPVFFTAGQLGFPSLYGIFKQFCLCNMLNV